MSMTDGGNLSCRSIDANAPLRSGPVLPWMRVPLAFDAGDGVLLEHVGGLDPRLRAALFSCGFETLFPVQTAVWEATSGGSLIAHDICLAAPTGSGKTLAYTLPILQHLSKSRRTCLRALMVVPTRDLALQVHASIVCLANKLDLQCVCACGTSSLISEAALLNADRVDILVATPGRLVAHIEGTPKFSLRDLEFLVVDEADRLLRQSYHGWLSQVLKYSVSPSMRDGISSFHRSQGRLLDTFVGRRIVKFVVSATLTRDPSKLDRLELQYPRYVALSSHDTDQRHKLPAGLSESRLVVPAERKAELLVALLTSVRPTKAIVFASSLETTHRLALLLHELQDLIGVSREYSAAMKPESRRQVLSFFREGSVTVLVSSDAMTRGMDVEDVGMVINYDAPVYVKTYVHRAGRTARAGKEGRVVTLLRPEEVKHFKAMVRKAQNSSIRQEKVPYERMKKAEDRVKAALDKVVDRIALKDDTVAPAQNRSNKEEGGGEWKHLGGAPQGAEIVQKKRKKRKFEQIPEIIL